MQSVFEKQFSFHHPLGCTWDLTRCVLVVLFVDHGFCWSELKLLLVTETPWVKQLVIKWVCKVAHLFASMMLMVNTWLHVLHQFVSAWWQLQRTPGAFQQNP